MNGVLKYKWCIHEVIYSILIHVFTIRNLSEITLQVAITNICCILGKRVRRQRKFEGMWDVRCTQFLFNRRYMVKPKVQIVKFSLLTTKELYVMYYSM